MDKYEKSKVLTIRYKKVKKLLKIIYGYDSFRPKQYEIINRIISGEDVCALLPTGQGKSICFQIPALYLNKPAIIIFPLISLMEDQQLILDKLGITSCCYNSSVQNKYEMRQDILNGKYQFIFLTPESVVKLKDFIIELNEKKVFLWWPLMKHIV
uniref:Putative ATP-dependent RNA helicase n=1 Tax=Moumouvirus sp. 'Monve' TaxID=1128131 RepID=H2EDZ9_9VIRU|nr:putative ATP-dependent RNA helicase [Moumouvirus Monve]